MTEMAGPTAATPRSVLLVRDARWPDVPGVCCWRSGFERAVTAAGAVATAATWAPSSSQGKPSGSVGMAAAADADLVVAEGVDAARGASRAGADRGRLWALALPPSRLTRDEPSGWGSRLQAVLGRLAGLLADSEAARATVEMAASPARPRVRVLPPVALDASCSRCGNPPERLATAARPDPAPLDAPGQLMLWRRILDEQATGTARPWPWSYPLSRILGPHAPWVGENRGGWDGAVEPPAAVTVVPGWTSADRDRAVAALLETAPRRARTSDDDRSARTVAVVGHDLKFIRELCDQLARDPGLDLVLDEWPGPAARNERVTWPLVQRSQTLLAEWARPNASWLSEVKRPDQLLVVRLHRFELEMPYPHRVDIDAVDAVVFIAPRIGRRIVDELGWPAAKLLYIPNFVDIDALDRPKLPGARFCLGLVGAVPALKRLDLALDLLRRVRSADPRFSLHVRTGPPWQHRASWRDPVQRRYWERCLQRVETDPLLRGAVLFDGGRDVAAWLRGIGQLLSVSDVEGSHVALSEGMAAGSVPVLRNWPGAAQLYGPQWVRSSLPEAAEAVLACADEPTWQRRSDQARATARRLYAPEQVVAAWMDLLLGRIEQARARFAPWSGLDR